MTPAERIVKIVADYYGQPIADVTLDTVLQSLTDHRIDPLDVNEIVKDIEEVFQRDTNAERHPEASESLTVRDFLRLVEPEGVGS